MMRRRVAVAVVSIVAVAGAFTRGLSAPTDPASARNRAAALLDNGEDVKAIDAFRDLARRHPDSAPDRVNLAIALIHHNDLDGAEAELRAALAKDAKDLRAHYNLGLIAKRRGKNEDAAKELEIVAASPEGKKDATVAYVLGIVYRRLRRPEDALAAFRRAVALRPEHASARFQLYNTLVQTGDRAAAAPELAKFNVLKKATPEFQQNEAYLERGLFTKIDAPGPLPAGESGGPKAAGAGKPEIRFEVRSSPAGKEPKDARVPTPEPSNPWSVAAALADFDGNGSLDLAVASSSGAVRVYMQTAGGYSSRPELLAGPGAKEQTGAETAPSSGPASDGALRRAPALAASDTDNDGDVDLLVAAPAGVQFFRNDRKGRFTDATKQTGLEDVSGSTAALWIDVDRDGDLDLILGERPALWDPKAPDPAKPARPRTPPRLLLNAGLYADGGTVASQPVAETKTGASKNTGTPGSSETGKTGAPARGPGSLRFVAAGTEAKLPDCGERLAAADLRGRDDADIVVACCSGASVNFTIARNRRSARFETAQETVGPAAALDLKAPNAGGCAPRPYLGDLDNDGHGDLVGFGSQKIEVFWNDGSGSFPQAPESLVSAGVAAGLQPGAAAVLDADGDGLLDVAFTKPSSAREARLLVLRNEGSRKFSASADAGLVLPAVGGVAALLAGDLDNDGDPDLAIATPDDPPLILANMTKTPNRFIKVSLNGGKTNKSGVGAKVEVRAERHFVVRESDGNPVIVGIGPRGRADSVRIVWTSGVTQDVVDVPAGPLKIEEKREFSGSCPFLYAWDGSTFRYVSEALSGAPVGFLRPDGAIEAPRPTEHLRLPPHAFVERAGRLSLRMTEEMRELTALDAVRLAAVDHPADVEVYSNERLTAEIEPFRYVAVRDLRGPVAAEESAITSVASAGASGKDGPLDDLSRLDGRAAKGFATLGPRLEGLAEPHVLSLRFDAPAQGSDRLALVLDGWVAWMTSDVSRALLQANSAGTVVDAGARTATSFAGRPISGSPDPWGPSLELRSMSSKGAAQSDPLFVADLGLPIGPSMLAPLPAGLPSGSGALDVRIGAGLTMFYDRIRLGTIVDAPLTVRELRPVEAELRWRGVAAARRAQDSDPTAPDYDAISSLSPFPRFEEGTTAPGDARELVAEADGRFVIFGTGEEVALEFEASALPPPAPGTTRTWFLVSTGYARDGDPNSKPLPWGPLEP